MRPGIGDSLYTPFSGPEGDGIDTDAYRALVRHCVGTLRHRLLWLTSGLSEFWALTLDERKMLLEIAVEEGRALNPDVVIQACTSAATAKDCLALTQHAQEAGADIVYIQTPPMEVHAGEGVLRFIRYVADRTDVALGLFNSPSSGYVLSPAEVASIYDAIPAVSAIKEGVMQPWRSKAIAQLAPGLVIWECDVMVYRAGWLRRGLVTPAQLGSAGYLNETAERPILSDYWELIWSDKISDAIDYAASSGLDALSDGLGSWWTCYPGRPDYFTHWGGAFKYAASVLGLPVGDFPDSRPPQAMLPEEAKTRIRSAYRTAGLIAP
ncbi:MAG TPA: dihydrodipicolinate synthase family protein [Acidimicrobiales bacterium]|nr:dihydrodipicolinate synthase family protein [Acidimicrobiales bacterium]